MSYNRPAKRGGEFAPQPSNFKAYGSYEPPQAVGGGYNRGSPKRGGPPGGMLDPLPGPNQGRSQKGSGREPSKQIWKMVATRLPTGKSPEDKKKREKIFSQIDVNGNGYLSLAEVDKGLRDVLQLEELFDAKPVIMRAFQAAKVVGQPKSNLSDDYVERKEFRLLLSYLRQYFEFKEMFDKIDTDVDHRIDYNEFLAGVKYLKAWGARIGEPLKVFKAMDGNKGGKVLFDEFADWAVKEKLDLEDDDNFEFDYAGELERMKRGNNMARGPPKGGYGDYNDGGGGGGVGGGGGGGRGPPQRGSPSNRRAPQQNTRMSTGKSIDWQHMASKLPVDDSKDSKEKRKMLFKLMDFNANGFLSLAEIDKGVRDVLDCENLFDAKPAIMRAYQASKNSRTGAKNNSDYVEPGEFKLLLIWLRQYFEYMVMFRKIDTGHDNRLDFGEFQAALPMLRKWGCQEQDAQKAFKIMDRNGGGQVLFDEFASWAIQYKLDLEDDVDFDHQQAIRDGGYKVRY